MINIKTPQHNVMLANYLLFNGQMFEGLLL